MATYNPNKQDTRQVIRRMQFHNLLWFTFFIFFFQTNKEDKAYKTNVVMHIGQKCFL